MYDNMILMVEYEEEEEKKEHCQNYLLAKYITCLLTINTFRKVMKRFQSSQSEIILWKFNIYEKKNIVLSINQTIRSKCIDENVQILTT